MKGVQMKAISFSAAVFILWAVSLFAQYPYKPVPRTMIECLEQKEGVLVLKGMTKVGRLHGSRGGEALFEAKEVKIANSGARQTGILVRIVEPAGPDQVGREAETYIDYDEIDPLLKALDHFSKINHTSTELDDYQAVFRTRGGFQISVKSIRVGEGIRVAVIDTSDVVFCIYITPADLPTLKNLIVTAKEKIDLMAEKQKSK